MTLHLTCGKCKAELMLEDASEMLVDTVMRRWMEEHPHEPGESDGTSVPGGTSDDVEG